MRQVVAIILLLIGLALAGSVFFPDFYSAAPKASVPTVPPAEPTKPPVRESLAVVGSPAYPPRLRVGGNGEVALTVKNDGTIATKEVWLQFDEKLFEGVILLDSTPSFIKDERTAGARFLKYPGLAVGESQQYRVRIVGKTSGEYNLNLYVSTGVSDGHHYDERVVVLP